MWLVNRAAHPGTYINQHLSAGWGIVWMNPVGIFRLQRVDSPSDIKHTTISTHPRPKHISELVAVQAIPDVLQRCWSTNKRLLSFIDDIISMWWHNWHVKLQKRQPYHTHLRWPDEGYYKWLQCSQRRQTCSLRGSGEEVFTYSTCLSRHLLRCPTCSTSASWSHLLPAWPADVWAGSHSVPRR